MSPEDFRNIVAKGTFLYDDTVECDVCITLSPVRYGSGDYEDPPEWRDDVVVDTYMVWFGSTTQRDVYKAGGGGYPSLAEAKEDVERRPGIGKSVRWTSMN